MHMRVLKAGALTILAIALTACEGLGEGNRLEKIEIVPGDGTNVLGNQVAIEQDDGSYKVFECFRHQMLLLGTFSDGSRGLFSSRGQWTSDAPEIVAVTQGGEDTPELTTLKFPAGVLRPVYADGATAGVPVTIRADFAGLTASIVVTVEQAQNVRFTTAGDPVNATVADTDADNPVYVPVGADVRLSAIADLDGRPRDITPSLDFSFDGNPPDEADPFAVFGQAIRSQPSNNIIISKTGNTITGLRRDGGPMLTAMAHFPVEDELCGAGAESSVATRPVRVGDISGTLRIEHEPVSAELDAAGAAFDGRLAVGSNEILQVIAGLDFDGNPDNDPEVEVDLSGQNSLRVDEMCDVDEDGMFNPVTCLGDHDGDGAPDFSASARFNASGTIVTALNDEITELSDADGNVTRVAIPPGTPAHFLATFTFPDPDTHVDSACSDGIDNDGDGLFDFGDEAGNDPGCVSASDTNEAERDTVSSVVDDPSDFAVTPVQGTLASVEVLPASANVDAFRQFQFDLLGTYCTTDPAPEDPTLCDPADTYLQKITRLATLVSGTPAITWSAIDHDGDDEAFGASISNTGILRGLASSLRNEDEMVTIRARASTSAVAESADNDDAGLAACETDPLCDTAELTVNSVP